MTDNNNSKKSDTPPFLDEAPPLTDDDYFIPDTSLEQVERFDIIPKTTNMRRDRKKYFPETFNEKKDKKDIHVNMVRILKQVFHFDSSFLFIHSASSLTALHL